MEGELLTTLSASPLPENITTFRILFPQYARMGMTFSQYWDDDYTLVEIYRNLYKEESESRAIRNNHNAWLQGRYVFEALNSSLAALFAKRGTSVPKYPDEPHELQRKKTNAEIRNDFYAQWDSNAAEWEKTHGKE